MSDQLLCVGTILGAHGLKGTLTVYSDTRPASGIAGYSFWYLGISPGKTKSYAVLRCWEHGKGGMLAELEGVTTREQAESLKKLKIWVAREAVAVDDDEYLWEDLINCEVYAKGVLMGIVVALEAYGAQDILCIHTLKDMDVQGEWLIPFTEDVVQSLDLEARRIDIHLLEGMDACFTPKS